MIERVDRCETWNDTDRGKRKYSEKKNRDSSTLSAISPAQMGLRANWVLRGEMPFNNCMSHGMVWVWFVLYCVGFINISYDILEKN